MKSAAVFALLLAPAGALNTQRDASSGGACAAEDLASRAMLHNKLADLCVDMCKEVGAYPEKCTCPNYVDTTDKTPGVMTWDELLKYMGDMKSWGRDQLKTWGKKITSTLQRKQAVRVAHASAACVAEDSKHRAALQNRLRDACIDMCKELGAYPEKCTCPNYVDTTDKTPGVITWEELLAYMEKVGTRGDEALKSWDSKAPR
mmetsp:Transcript_62236/g.187788  ORF Transcript_62236/g.187788 Transcript_62236/m.187788 type:complete len:203 (-) Transcript_62236:220-828(-)